MPGETIFVRISKGIALSDGAPAGGDSAALSRNCAALKFAAMIREALGRDPDYPPGCENLESLPQRFEVMDADAAAVKAYIARHAGL